MTNNELMITVRSAILEQLITFGKDYAVEQDYQPTQAATNSKPTIYVHHIGDTPVGTAQRSEFWDAVALEQVRIQKQLYTTRVQVSATIVDTPLDPASLTVIDVLRIARWCVQSVEFADIVKPRGLSVLRVADMPSYDVQGDTPGYDKRPTFDIIFQHEDVIRRVVPGFTSIEINRLRV